MCRCQLRDDEAKLLFNANKNVIIQKEKIRIALQICEGMAFLHSLNPPIIHRDLKTLNIMMDVNYNVKIGDFGTARRMNDYMTQGRGTLQWMAPEVIEGNSYSEYCDVFSFGIILHEILTLIKPYPAIKGDVVRDKVRVDPNFRPVIMEGMDEVLVKMMKSCWAAEQSERTPFEDLVEQLEKYSKTLPDFC